MESLSLHYPDFTFIDFGSGKGRALLLASQYPFRRVLGIEFSPELHVAAQENLRIYPPHQVACSQVESICQDFLEFSLPPEPSVLFFFDPCSEILFRKTLENIRTSSLTTPRPLLLVYVAPGRKERLLQEAGFLVKLTRNDEFDFSVYRSR
jgi:hypothetical protein